MLEGTLSESLLASGKYYIYYYHSIFANFHRSRPRT
jgi:hypothetical protein